jgi:hypothetical protein
MPQQRMLFMRSWLDAMVQERRVAAIVRSTYEVDRGTQVILFLYRRNLANDIKLPIIRDLNNTQSSGAVRKRWFIDNEVSSRIFKVPNDAGIFWLRGFAIVYFSK